MNFYRISRLGRPFDLKLTSNWISILGPVVVGAGSLAWDVVRGDSLELLEAARASVTAFLAWSMARELDPDRPGTATLALVLAAAAAVIGPWQVPLIVSAAALLGLRVLAGTVGGDLKPADLVLLVGLAVYSGTRIDGWVVVLLLVLGLLDSRPSGYLLAVPAMFVGAAAGAFATDTDLPAGPMPDEVWLWTLITIAAIPLAVRSVRIRSRTDIFDHPIVWPKVRAARVMAGFVVFGGLLASSNTTVVLLIPVLTALLATALVRTFRPA